ncbi:hypothetical protein ACNUDN_29115 [Mycobacterium sp. smrl_JER01]|uniref:NLP/P60 protein n=1 Tax=Mycolicibacterium gilvum (strain PYR-GCK) TaxID=350054 RepID=A4TG19_MYCGI|nr:hypothetical protein [Mycobacterium sp. shizuoka-1]GAY16113.1 hypothetical protein MSZK_28390 [Mycobacterium sp. shizuoka-1]
MHPVDAALQQARQLLGNLTPPELTPPAYGGQVSTPTDWTGTAAERAGTVHTELDTNREDLRATHKRAATAVASANRLSEEARTGLTAVETSWQQDKAILGPLADTPTGQAALLQAGQLRITEAAQLIEQTATQYATIAEQLAASSAELPHSVENPTATQAVDFKTDKPDTEGPPDKRSMPIITEPGGLGPPGTIGSAGTPNWIEIGQDTGIWLPDNELDGLYVTEPGGLGPSSPYGTPGWVELLPDSGYWLPKDQLPDNAIYQTPGSLGPPGTMGSATTPDWVEWIPGSGIWLPDDKLRSP